MSTELDKQEEKFWDGWLNIWLQEHPAICPSRVLAIAFAAAFASQVREQTIVKIFEGGFYEIAPIEELRKFLIAAPPQTTDEGKK